MRRITIAPPAEVLERIRDEAVEERRTPKGQVEYILIQYVRERSKADPADTKEVAHVG